jgi:hypothetical protein
LPRNDQWKAPTPDLEGHRKRLREALGNTLSDEFVDVILGKLVEALRPGLYDQLEEATLNAALAMGNVSTFNLDPSDSAFAKDAGWQDTFDGLRARPRKRGERINEWRKRVPGTF